MKSYFYKFLMAFLALFMAIPPVWADETLIVCDGTAYNEYMPLASAYATSSATNVTQQIIYPKSNFADLAVGSKIKSIKFFDTSSYANLTTPFGSRVIVVRIGEVPDGTVVTGTDKSANGGNGTLYNRNLMTTYTEVYSGNPTINGQELSFTFTEEYTYNGGNLAIELYYPQGAGNGSTINWYGVNGTTACSGHYRYVSSASGNNKYRVSLQAFLPKMSITYEGGSTTPTVAIAPEALTINDDAAGTFTVTGTNVGGSINASLASNTDWYMTPEQFANTGGDLSISYTGRALSASNTINVTAASDNTVSAQATVNYVADLYIVTDNGATDQWDFNNGTAMDYNNGVYTATFTAENPNTYILFARKLGDGVNWNTRYVFGPNSNGNWWMQGENASGAIDLYDDDPIYFPDAGTYTITINASDNTFTITKYVQPDYAVTVNPDGGTLNFGDVQYNQSSRSSTIIVTNIGLQPVTPTLSALTDPFSTEYTATELAPGESMSINIIFTPTEEGTATGNLTLSFGNGIADRNFSLTGNGVQYGANDHSATYDHEYTWVDDNGNEHTSNLLDVATDPNQIIAMLREIYITPEIPGNKYRGYTEDGAAESLIVNGNDAFKVNYSAVGQLNSNLQYTDTYGWNIPTERQVLSFTKGSYTYNYMDPTEYEPQEEGVTLIMVEIKDGANYSGSNYYSFTNSTLKEKVANTFKSARIITTYKKSGSGEEAGTLFKIDADKLNRFFFLAKGQLRIIDHSQAYESLWTSTNVCPFPSMKVSSYGNTFTDNSFNTSSGSAVLAPFEHMFEEFSPNQASTATNAMTDVYQELVNMVSYDVVHDCVSIPYVEGNHEFNMYGVESTSEDCQDVRDMMFFVPDYRMKFWKESQYASGDKARDPNSVEKFVNYNKEHRPTLGLYVIRQNEITGEKQASADVYDLHLSWESNLLDFLPGDEAEYNLYRVETDEDGNKTYIYVATIDPGVTTYTDQVPMQEHGQQVTYVVQGQDTEHFLSLQMSNEESYIIPGLDKSEIFTLSPKTEDYSRFDPQTERNYYANQLRIINNVGTNVKSSYLGNGAKFTFYRTPSYGATTGDKVPVFIATSDGNGTLTIQSQNQRESGLYNEWINMVNPTSVTYSVDGNDNVTFNNFSLYDNFWVSVADNDHPSLYIYEVELEASTTIADTEGTTAHSNQIGVFVHKTDMDILGYTKQQIDDDTDHALETGTRYMNEEVKYSSKTEILRYDNYRWNQEDEDLGVIIDWANSSRNQQTGGIITESDMEPTGQAGNQATEYTVKMDGVNSGSILIGQGQTTFVTYEDKIVEDQWGVYTYAPVVETFTTRSDYNTYGAPVQQTGVATIEAKVDKAIMSSKSKGATYWTVDGKIYTHYTVTLDMSKLLIPISQDALKDYDLYKVRVWRQVDPSLLKEQVYTGNNVGKNRAERVTGDFLMEEVDYYTFGRDAVDNETGISLYKLGSNENLTSFYPGWTKRGNEEVMATFGAQKLRESAAELDSVIEALPMHFIVRAYYTRTANISQASSLRGVDVAQDGKYYIAQYEFDYILNEENPPITGLSGVVVDPKEISVTYYNLMGQPSSQPYEGVNIVVTRYSDGRTLTSKVLK